MKLINGKEQNLINMLRKNNIQNILHKFFKYLNFSFPALNGLNLISTNISIAMPMIGFEVNLAESRFASVILTKATLRSLNKITVPP